MLTAVVILQATFLLAKKNFKITSNINKETIILFGTTLMFWLIHTLVVEDKKIDRYTELWDEPGIQTISFIQCIIFALIILKNVLEIENVQTILLIMFVLDIVAGITIYNTYSFKMKETIIDAFQLQIKNARIGLFIVFMGIVGYNTTIVGALVIISVCGIILGFKK